LVRTLRTFRCLRDQLRMRIDQCASTNVDVTHGHAVNAYAMPSQFILDQQDRSLLGQHLDCGSA
jgi:hypothetical protein